MTWNWLKHAFAVDSDAGRELSDDERRVIDRLCGEVVSRGLAGPAAMLLEMSRPLNYLGAQALHFFQPMISALTDVDGPRVFAAFLERRDAIDILCRTLETRNAERKTGG